MISKNHWGNRSYMETRRLPDVGALVLWNVELITLLDVESIVPSVDLRQSGIDTCLTRRVRIDGNDILYILRADVAGPYARPRKEEPLLGSETVLNSERIGLQAVLKSTESHVETSVVANVLTEGQFSVNLLSGNGINGAEIVFENLGAYLIVLLVLLRPPVILVTRLVELRA